MPPVTDAAAQAVALLAAELKAITEAKAAADARQKALTDALSQLGGLITPPAPPKPSIGQRAAGLWSALPHVNLLWVVVIVLGLIVAHDHAALPAWPSWLHWPSVVKPVVPFTAHLHATLIYDADEATQADAAVRESPTIKAALKALDTDWRTLDKTSDAAALATRGLLPIAANVGLPALVIQDDTGKVHAATKLPATEADVIGAVKKLRGGT